MNKLQTAFLTGTLALASAAFAQESQPPPATQPESAPATSPTEGTAADRTPPGQTTTTQSTDPGTVNPSPSTDPSEGTAADRTPPGQTANPQDTTRMAAAGGARGTSVSEIIGASVQGTDGQNVGTVQDILINQSGKVAVVVQQSGSSSATGAQPTAIPWDAIRSMEPDGKIVVDSSRVTSTQQR
jgi:sporulation protein YlmC with PRC-barrel domain